MGYGIRRETYLVVWDYSGGYYNESVSYKD